MKQKIIIKVLLVLVVFFGTRSIVWSQKSPENKAKCITKKMDKKLALTTEQEKVVYQLNLTKVEIRQKKYKNKESKKENSIASRTAWKEGLKQILTDEQIKKMKRLNSN